MNLRSVDLNLLVVLQQLLQEKHVSRAAERLNMSQPAVSRALQRLRVLLDDPLLVRTSYGYDLSERAATLLPQLKQLLKDTQELITSPVFDPSSSTQTVRFYGPDPAINQFLPPLFERIHTQAPNMSVEVRSDPMDHFSLLESGDVHFVFSPFQPDANLSQFRSLPLKSQEFGVVMKADGPLANGELSIEKFIRASHGVVALTGRGPNLLDAYLQKQGYLDVGEQLNVSLRLSSFSLVANFCERSDVMFHLPRHFAEELVKGRNLVVRELVPKLTMGDVTTYLYWHERYHKDAMCCWVREQLKLIL